MRTCNAIPLNILSQAAAYDPETGRLTRLKVANRHPVGSELGWLNKSTGYRYFHVGKFTVLSHRAGWALTFGVWPDLGIDHINGITTDNRLCNLRPATQSQNLANRPVRRDSTSGIKGVRKSPNGKWEARIALGGFETAEQAADAHAFITRLAWGEFGLSDGHVRIAGHELASRELGALDSPMAEGDQVNLITRRDE